MCPEIRELIDAVDEKNKTQADLEQQIKFLKEEVDRLNFTLKEQRILIKEQEEKLSSSEKTEELPKDVQILKEMIFSQRKELLDKDDTIEMLHEEIFELKESSFEASKSATDEEISEKLQASKQEIELLRDQNEGFEAEIQYLQNQIDDANNKSPLDLDKSSEMIDSDLKTELNEKDEIISTLTQKIETMEDYIQTQDEFNTLEIEDKYSKELSKSKEKIQNLQDEVEELQELVVYLQEKYDRLNQQGDVSLEEISKEGASFNLEYKAEEMQQTISQLKMDLEEAIEKVSEQDILLVKKNIKISALTQEVEKANFMIEDLRNTVSSAKNKDDSLEGVPVYDLDEISQLNDIIDDLKKENRNLKDKNANLAEQLSISSEIIEKLEIENETINEKLDSIEKDKEEPVILIEDMQAEREANINQYEFELSSLAQEKAELLKRNESLKEEIENLQNKINTIERENVDLVEKNDMKFTQIKQLEKERQLQQIQYKSSKLSEDESFSRSYDINLFLRTYNLLDDYSKDIVIDTLLNDLGNVESNVKISALLILGQFLNVKILDAFGQLVNDKDWLVRCYLAKVLGVQSNENAIRYLNKLKEDKDVDVRETANLSLNNLKNKIEKLSYRKDFTDNRWNWSEKDEKWVYVEALGNPPVRNYIYRLEPPQEFVELSLELKKLNKKLMDAETPEENERIFKELMKISNKMQEMRS